MIKFLHSTCHLILIAIYMKFCGIVCKLQSQHDFVKDRWTSASVKVNVHFPKGGDIIFHTVEEIKTSKNGKLNLKKEMLFCLKCGVM